MILNLIKSNPVDSRIPQQSGDVLNVAEMFCNTIQGEGINAGIPATFLRLQNCTLKCTWCDTLEVWRFGNPYHVGEILDIWGNNGMVAKFRDGQHLVLTGGSPLLQQDALSSLIVRFYARNGFYPYVEVENECMILPNFNLSTLVKCWNNSPKLSNSGMKKQIRYKEDVIYAMGKLENSWFKFVVSSENDWNEIVTDFLDTKLIRKNQVILMPEGQTREELQKNYEKVVELAVQNNVRVSDRMHVTIWNKKTGV